MSVVSNDSNDLTTDALPSPPRENLDHVQNTNPSRNEDVNNASSKHSNSSNSRKESDSDESDHCCSRNNSNNHPKRFTNKISEGIPATSAFANVINISNASGVQIGSNYTYIIKHTKDNDIKKTKHVPKTDKIISLLNSQELVTEKDLPFFASHMDEAWKETARKLDYSEGQISQFHSDFINSGIKEVIHQLLLDWLRNNGEAATMGKLIDALWNTGQKDCVMRWSQK
ncbi:hypothetical protein HHI36_022800 [Cryptolaemus montrouzieri]